MELYGIEIIEISQTVFQRLAYRQTTEGVIGIVKAKHHRLNGLVFNSNNPLVLVAEAPKNPGISVR